MEQVPRKNSLTVFIYFLIIALDSISFGLIAPILAPLLADSSLFFSHAYSPFWHYCLYGLLISLFPLTFMLGAPILGTLSDRYGRKKILLACLMLSVVAFCSYACAFTYKNLSMLILGRMLAGVSAGSQGVAQAAVVDFANQREKPLIISTIAIGMTMGLILGPLVATLWTHAASWIPFVVVIFLSIIAILLLWRVRDDQRVISYAQTSWRSFLSKSGVGKLLGIFFLFELGWSLYFQTLPLWLSVHWHLQHAAIGFINSYVGAMLAVCLFMGTRIGLRFISLAALIQLGFGIGVLGLCMITLSVSFIYFLILALPVVFAVALVYPGIITQLSELSSAEQQGLLMGVTDALLALAFAITGMLSSLLTYFNPYLPFFIAALFWIIASIGCLKLKKVALCNSV
jgi:DHA1 family tetracycline resistance protein-like MFS transporter